MKLTIISETNPFLRADFEGKEKLYAESDSMVLMSEGVSLKGRMQGGLFQAIARKVVNDESFFTQEFTSEKDASVLLGARLPSTMTIIDIDAHNQFLMNDGAFLCHTEHVKVEVVTQSILNGLFANSGGFFVGKATGNGQLVVCGFGSVIEMVLDGAQEFTIDNQHVVAWQDTLSYSTGMTTASNQGFFGKIVNSVTSGEGLVLKFKGKGKIYISSINRNVFFSDVQNAMNPFFMSKS